MRTARAFVATATVAGLLAIADRAFAQQTGQLRVAMRLTDSRAGVTYPAVKKLLTITAETGTPVYSVETGREGTIEISLPPGVYVVESGPVPFQGRHYRWSRTVDVDSGAVIVLELNERNGQSTLIESSERGPFVAPFVQYGAPQRLTGGLSVLLPVGRTVTEGGILGARGIQLQASGGRGGWRAGAGAGAAGLPFWWADVLVTVTRTTADPRGALPESTYVGVEAGCALILPLDEWVYLPFSVMIKPNLGVARRLDGPAGQQPTMFTWSVGTYIHAFTF